MHEERLGHISCDPLNKWNAQSSVVNVICLESCCTLRSWLWYSAGVPKGVWVTLTYSKLFSQQITKAHAQSSALRCIHLKPHMRCICHEEAPEKLSSATEQWLQTGGQDVRRQRLYLRHRAASPAEQNLMWCFTNQSLFKKETGRQLARQHIIQVSRLYMLMIGAKRMIPMRGLLADQADVIITCLNLCST